MSMHGTKVNTLLITERENGDDNDDDDNGHCDIKAPVLH